MMRTREFRRQKSRTSAAKAEFRNAIYGTAEAVPFRDRVLTQTLTAPTRRGIKPLVGDTLVGGLR
jgi:hypothetical protein